MSTLWQSICYGYRYLCSRKLYLIVMVFVPLLCTLFFLSLMREGLPVRVPTAIVDLDNSTLSRSMTRSLDAVQMVDITTSCESYQAARAAVQRGEVYGFYIIPRNFQEDALAGRKPVINYYCDMTYFVPGSFSYKGYKSVAVQATAAMVAQAAAAKGVNANTMSALIRPISIDVNQIHNPWTNYSLYLTPSFSAGILELIIIMVTIMTLMYEIKEQTSRRWLRNNNNSIVMAVTGKLLPQTLIFCIVGWCMQALIFGYAQFPIHCSRWVLFGSMFLFVLACQGFGLFVACIMPNPRMALSIGTLFAMLAFSFTGFSFPVQDMYGALGVFSWFAPVRYYFMIHIQQVLNGVDLWYSRWWFVILIVMALAPMIMLWRLKRACIKQVYIP